VAEIVETLATVDQNPALEACKSCLKRLGTDMWTTLIGTLDEPTATPYVNVGIRPMMIPFFYVRFGVDDRYEVAYNELVTDLLHALYKLRKLREYLQQLVSNVSLSCCYVILVLGTDRLSLLKDSRGSNWSQARSEREKCLRDDRYAPSLEALCGLGSR
jgi:hypothetical protein